MVEQAREVSKDISEDSSSVLLEGRLKLNNLKVNTQVIFSILFTDIEKLHHRAYNITTSFLHRKQSREWKRTSKRTFSCNIISEVTSHLFSCSLAVVNELLYQPTLKGRWLYKGMNTGEGIMRSHLEDCLPRVGSNSDSAIHHWTTGK